ncbi:dihydrofolate reductase [Salicibibacter halophilus]|uniref:Dihydrofolate reductase n=1 Tax=Salicibibacter halophilus TaxID=2502791 RepID=A0A514LHK0_9BACI|nr:dihydrofolate reductase [Salicibibacter halophilus]QDI91326.1 dihydrofolate reductase [Salicibibacter halophilus]
MLSMMVAHDRNRGIGKDNAMPWHLPADLSFLKKNTVGKTIVMGRSTFEAIGRPLPKRKNIVLTTQQDFDVEGVETAHAIETIIAENDRSEVEWVILGGSNVYEQAFPYVDRLYITFIDEAFEVDRFFPSFDKSEWELKWQEKGIKNEENPYDYWFQVYDRKKT